MLSGLLEGRGELGSPTEKGESRKGSVDVERLRGS
jgi:hypothetical protein